MTIFAPILPPNNPPKWETREIPVLYPAEKADALIKDMVEALDAAETILSCSQNTISNAGGGKPMMSTVTALAMVRGALKKARGGI